MAKLVDLDLLQYYDGKIKNFIGEEDAKSIKHAYLDEATNTLKLFKEIPEDATTATPDFSIEIGGAIEISTDDTSTGMLKSYTISQNGETVGVIDIPKDLVVTAGEVVKDPDGQAAGTYVKLTIANQDAPIYINVADLVDAYTAAASATQVQVAISETNEVSASLVANSVTATEIKDGVITAAKLDSTFKDSLLTTDEGNFATESDIDNLFG